MLFQFPDDSFFAETVFEEVAFGIKDLELDKGETSARVKDTLNLIGIDIEQFGERNPFTLSAGERRRVAIAAVLIMDSPVTIFDESTLGLDWEGRSAIVELLRNLREAGKTIIVISHDCEFVKSTADRLLLIDHGRVHWQGRISDTGQPREFMNSKLGWSVDDVKT